MSRKVLAEVCQTVENQTGEADSSSRTGMADSSSKTGMADRSSKTGRAKTDKVGSKSVIRQVVTLESDALGTP